MLSETMLSVLRGPSLILAFTHLPERAEDHRYENIMIQKSTCIPRFTTAMRPLSRLTF